MRFIKTTLTGCALLALLTSCETQTPDGKVPDKYAQQVAQFLGTYRGGLNGGSSGQLIISMSKDNVVSARFTGSDLIGKGCNTKLGTLQSVSGSGSTITGAKFQLQSGCVDGSSLELTIGASGQVSAQVYSRSETTNTCPSDYEIRSCQDKVDAADRSRQLNGEDEKYQDDLGFDCQPPSFGGFNDRNCRSESDRDYENCSSCYDSTEKYYVYGSFSR